MRIHLIFLSWVKRENLVQHHISGIVINSMRYRMPNICTNHSIEKKETSDKRVSIDEAMLWLSISFLQQLEDQLSDQTRTKTVMLWNERKKPTVEFLKCERIGWSSAVAVASAFLLLGLRCQNILHRTCIQFLFRRKMHSRCVRCAFYLYT